MNARAVFFATTLCMALLAALPGAAQNVRGSISGVVKDASGAVIAGAHVTTTHLDTNRTQSTRSDGSGEFAFTLLPPGRYRVQIEQSGFRKKQHEVVLQVNQDVRRELQLEVGQAAGNAVEVRTIPEMLRTQTGSVGTVIENRQVTGLPLDGRNFAELSLLLPGVAPSAQGSAVSVRGGFSFSVNGGREESNVFLLDGVYNGDPTLNGAGVTPPVDAIYEFEVLTNSYDAAFGRNAGGQINVALRNGGNQFHGTAYEFFRNAALDARNHFAPRNEPKPKFQRNQFGASLGGPIARDRTFFFADYERRIAREGITRLTTVPTQAERAGDFSASCLPAPGPGCPFLAAFGGFVLFLPPAFQHPVGAAIVNLYPAPNRTPSATSPVNFVSSPTQRDNEHHFDVRVDHRLAAISELAVRYSFADRDFFEPFSTAGGASLIPGFGNHVTPRSQNLMVSETHTFSPNFVNEFRFGFNRVASAVTQENAGVDVNAAVGLPSPGGRDSGLSQIHLTGLATLGHEVNSPNAAQNNTWQILDHATWIRGRHTLKFGGDFRKISQNAFRDVQARGFLNFTGLLTSSASTFGNPVAELLLGLPTVTGRAIVDNPQRLRAESYHFFASDTWRVLPDLVLTAGLRYEFLSPPVDPRDRAQVYDPATGSIVPVGTGTVPRAGYHADKNNFGPRLGLAWTLPHTHSNTVLRAGYGMYFDQSPLAPGEGLYFSPPFFTFNLAFQFTGLPPLTLTNPFPGAAFPIPTPPSALSYQRDLRTAYVQHWSFGVQQKIGAARVVEVLYAGSKGTKLLSGRDINQPGASPIVPNLRPNPQFDDITAVESRASSRYNSLQLRLQQNLHRGLSVLSAYTLSKSFDDASSFFASDGDPNFPQDSNNVRAERAASNFDTRHRFSLSYSYDIPGPKQNDWARRILGGWQSFGVLSLQSGRPFTVALLSTQDQSNTGRSVLGFGANDRPNITGSAVAANPSETAWFNTTAFSLPTFGSFGNAGRNILTGPGLATFNFSMLKNLSATERFHVQFRTEFFNLFNRTNYNLPDNFFGSPTFGQITSAGQPRRVQFGLKLLW
jgi:hypothetical protein